MRYSIEGQELTDIANVLRKKYGDTEMVTGEYFIETQVSRTQNFDGFEQNNGQRHEHEGFYTEIKIPNAKKIKVKIYYNLTSSQYVRIAEGERPNGMYANDLKISGTSTDTVNYEFNGDTVTFYWSPGAVLSSIYGYYAECTGYETEKEVARTYQTSEMAAAIEPLDFMPEEAFTITESCNYRFAYNGWNWFINTYGNNITTNDITSTNYMFFSSTGIEEIPFEFNCKASQSIELSAMFRLSNIRTVPKINNCNPYGMSYLFADCKYLRYLPDDIATWFDWTYFDSLTSGYSGSMSNMFTNCYSLRSIPSELFAHNNKAASYSASYLYSGFGYCTTLDELVDLPLPYTAVWTSNAFSSSFGDLNRIKNLTFAMPNGKPCEMKWKSQTIDLSKNIGYASGSNYILGYNSGITEDKKIGYYYGEPNYDELKDDPDAWTLQPEFSRYNHDSAVATINSLPDTSAYLASAGGTNTIKFKKGSGRDTDGGAIENLTEEEIAVAAAKGWTVTLVN